MSRILPIRTIFPTLAVGILMVTQGIAVEEGAGLDDYHPAGQMSGTLNSIGSDTLNNLMTMWGEGFGKHHPRVTVQIEGKGSSTAPPALIEGMAHIGPMSRCLKPDEVDAFEKRHGYAPTEVRVAIDGLAVFVHKDNPLKGLTVQQLDSLFSKSRKQGGSEIVDWSQLGITEWRGRGISLFGRNSASGSYGFFQELVMRNGDFKPTVQEQPGSSSVVQGVGADRHAIGYSGIGYRTSGVRALPLSMGAGKFYEPSYENSLSGDYPLARFLVVYIHRKPGHGVDPLTREFLRFVLSKEGQQIVSKVGYYPLPGEIAGDSIRVVGN